MATDSQNHQNGLSGQGGANYSSAAWRAGDSERQRQQSLASESGSDGNMYGVPILIFMGLCVWGAIEFTDYFNIHVENENYLWGGAAAVGYVVGIILRNFLLMMFGLVMGGFLLILVGMVIYNIATDQGDVNESKSNPVSHAKPSIQELVEVVKDTQSTATVPDEYKCAACSIYSVEELSDSHRESCIKMGCSFSKTPSRPIRARPE